MMRGGAASVDAALAQARQAGVDRLDAQLLLAHLLQRPRTWLIAHGDAPLDAPLQRAWQDLLRRRAGGEPLAYLIGSKEFFGLVLQVDRAVLVPRPDTETLVDWALERLQQVAAPQRPLRLVDLGTGSGAIALALKSVRDGLQVVATDASDAALAVAAANGRRLGLDVDWRHGDWWQAVTGMHFDLALANPPYVAAGDPHLQALRDEPIDALASGSDGLQALRRIIGAAPGHLQPGAWLLVEHGHEQADAVCSLLESAGLRGIEVRADLAGQPRCSGGFLP